MAQVNAQYPDLSRLFGQYSVAPVEYGLQQFESAQNADRLNQGQALQDMLFQQQNDPLKLQRSGLENQGLEAGLPGLWAQSSLAQDKAAVSRGSIGEQIQGGKQKALADISDSDLKLIENNAQRMAMSQDPQERELGALLLKQHKDIIREKEKQGYMMDRQIGLERVRGEETRKTQGQAIEAGKYARSGGSGGGLADVDAAAKSGKLGFEKAATAYAAAAQEAAAAGNADEAVRLFGIANQYNQMYIQGRQAGAQATQAGKVDVGATTGMPVVPQRPVEQFNAPGAPAAAPKPQKQTLQQVQQMYPGIPPEKLREAYKKKFGVDLN